MVRKNTAEAEEGDTVVVASWGWDLLVPSEFVQHTMQGMHASAMPCVSVACARFCLLFRPRLARASIPSTTVTLPVTGPEDLGSIVPIVLWNWFVVLLNLQVRQDKSCTC